MNTKNLTFIVASLLLTLFSSAHAGEKEDLDVARSFIENPKMTLTADFAQSLKRVLPGVSPKMREDIVHAFTLRDSLVSESQRADDFNNFRVLKYAATMRSAAERKTHLAQLDLEIPIDETKLSALEKSNRRAAIAARFADETSTNMGVFLGGNRDRSDDMAQAVKRALMTADKKSLEEIQKGFMLRRQGLLSAAEMYDVQALAELEQASEITSIKDRQAFLKKHEKDIPGFIPEDKRAFVPNKTDMKLVQQFIADPSNTSFSADFAQSLKRVLPNMTPKMQEEILKAFAARKSTSKAQQALDEDNFKILKQASELKTPTQRLKFLTDNEIDIPVNEAKLSEFEKTRRITAIGEKLAKTDASLVSAFTGGPYNHLDYTKEMAQAVKRALMTGDKATIEAINHSFEVRTKRPAGEYAIEFDRSEFSTLKEAASIKSPEKRQAYIIANESKIPGFKADVKPSAPTKNQCSILYQALGKIK